MKIGILTFHRAFNYGAVLQCYALQETLKRMGHNVEVIDYRQPMIEKAYKCIKWNWLAKKIIKFWKLPGYLKVIIQNLKQRKRFLNFLYTYLNINNSHFDSVIPDGYDYYIIGSDQLFNIKITNGLDPIYSAKFKKSDHSKVIGYAISTSKESINAISKDEWSGIFERFDAISFRENILSQEIYKLYGKAIEVCLDPTLLSDCSIWDKIKHNSIIKKGCIVLYEVRKCKTDRDILLRKAKQLAKMSNSDIVNLSNKQFSIEEWILYIKNAKCVVTSSFHATVFALIFNRPFYTFKLEDGNDTRYIELLENLEASDCLLQLNDSMTKIPEIDYGKINKHLMELRQHSLEFLSNHIC